MSKKVKKAISAAELAKLQLSISKVMLENANNNLNIIDQYIRFYESLLYHEDSEDLAEEFCNIIDTNVELTNKMSIFAAKLSDLCCKNLDKAMEVLNKFDNK